MTEGMLELLQGLRQGAAEHPDLRRNRLRQDHAAERAVRPTFRKTSASSPSKTRPNCGCSRPTWRAWKPGRANIEGTGAIRIRQLVINALRMRPDRIIVGEVRGEEALDMLQAMNTGHDGSLTTIHANTPRDGLGRLEVMVGMANANMGVRSIRQQIASRRGPVRADRALQRWHPPHHAHHRSASAWSRT